MKTCFQITEMQPFLCKDNKKVLITAQKSFFLRLLGCYKHFFGYFLLDKQAYIGKMGVCQNSHPLLKYHKARTFTSSGFAIP